ncbi:MAG: hypothetical protein M1815_005411 [Lichina confinis]|nr:MAG: hypothetical protein M1815_005411 [Lichina confinis]
MPAPLAKGLIIAASVLVAAGIAVYEHPQVQEWFERTRRRIAVVINGPADGHDEAPYHAGIKGENVAAAVEAARRKREEILAKNGALFVRPSANRHPASSSHSSSHELQERNSGSNTSRGVTSDDVLKTNGSGGYTLRNTSAQPTSAGEPSLRLRSGGIGESSVENKKTGLGSTNETQVLFDAEAENDIPWGGDETRQGTADSAPRGDDAEPLLRFNEDASSQSSSGVLATPPSTDSGRRSTPGQSPRQGQPRSSTYSSINEWAASTSPAFHTSPPAPASYDAFSAADNPFESEVAPSSSTLRSSTQDVTSVANSDDEDGVVEVSGDAHDSDAPYSDIISQTSGMHTPATWTEVGSEVSDGDFGGQ